MKKEELKAYFFQNPSAKLRVRQLERATSISLPAVIKYTNELVKEKFLQLYEVSGVRFFTSAQTKEFYRAKQLYNLKQLYDSGLVDYLEEHNANVILFGSFSIGEDREESDIDLYVECSEELRKTEDYSEVLRKELHIFRHSNLKSIKNKQLTNNILNGITLTGTVKVYKGKELGRLSQELRAEVAKAQRRARKNTTRHRKSKSHRRRKAPRKK
ncbi:MAG: nucleotidyltransferase domain-containing protein [Candidatus Woesearchaeota archaeon]|nr:nucleotidyltransferase domain-containing protein [Candidatus Woesearchaeota archaeon]